MSSVGAGLVSLWLAGLYGGLTSGRACVRPRTARCPVGFDLRTGVRSDGRFACWPHPVGDPRYDGTWGRPERSVQPPWVIESQLYCTGGTRPIVVDARTVGCQRRAR